ncbi:MAG: hypothetical protein PHQ35_09545 [Phycisphaerae bacterium]|nr:hypothetical protein [Phycisphaerae bacterium]MDD5239959.1 hypothetical protein [Candidatus Nanoarchaeia archaeon]
MKVWEKIATFDDTRGWTKERIAAEAYMQKYCPSEMEEDYHFIGKKRFADHCKIGCGVKCLEEYLELEAKVK